MGTICSCCAAAESPIVQPYRSPEIEAATIRYQDSTIDNTPPFILRGNRLPCRILRVIDGDTVDLVTDAFPVIQGMHRFRCRLAGIDAPEHKPLKSKPNRLEEIAAAHRSTEALDRRQKETNGVLLVDFQGADKYGRLLVILYDVNEESINQWLIREGYAVAYDGGKKDILFRAIIPPASFEGVVSSPLSL